MLKLQVNCWLVRLICNSSGDNSLQWYRSASLDEFRQRDPLVLCETYMNICMFWHLGRMLEEYDNDNDNGNENDNDNNNDNGASYELLF